MNKFKLIATNLLVALSLSSCALTTAQIESKTPYVRVTSYLAADKVIKDSKNKEKTKSDILKVAKVIKSLDSVTSLSPVEFKAFIVANTKLGESAKVIIDSLYLIYRDETVKFDTENLTKLIPVINAIVEGLELAAS
jgi:hypothetical protein